MLRMLYTVLPFLKSKKFWLLKHIIYFMKLTQEKIKIRKWTLGYFLTGHHCRPAQSMLRSRPQYCTCETEFLLLCCPSSKCAHQNCLVLKNPLYSLSKVKEMEHGLKSCPTSHSPRVHDYETNWWGQVNGSVTEKRPMCGSWRGSADFAALNPHFFSVLSAIIIAFILANSASPFECLGLMLAWSSWLELDDCQKLPSWHGLTYPVRFQGTNFSF